MLNEAYENNSAGVSNEQIIWQIYYNFALTCVWN